MYIIFKKITYVSKDDLRNFNIIGKLTNDFTRNVISRFSNFYSRQGQPVYTEDVNVIVETIKLEAESKK